MQGRWIHLASSMEQVTTTRFVLTENPAWSVFSYKLMLRGRFNDRTFVGYCSILKRKAEDTHDSVANSSWALHFQSRGILQLRRAALLRDPRVSELSGMIAFRLCFGIVWVVIGIALTVSQGFSIKRPVVVASYVESILLVSSTLNHQV